MVFINHICVNIALKVKPRPPLPCDDRKLALSVNTIHNDCGELSVTWFVLLFLRQPALPLNEVILNETRCKTVFSDVLCRSALGRCASPHTWFWPSL